MTLSLAWVRNLGGLEELVVATDSRLRFGCAWDCCPKIFMLPRSDSVICFAGDTMYAYPIMEQVRYAIEMYPKARSRAMDLGSMRGHIVRILNKMYGEIHDFPRGVTRPGPPKTAFILAGFSWLTSDFKIWLLYYNVARKQFEHASTNTLHRNKICFSGDHVEEAKRRILSLVRSRKKQPGSGFDMEPFEVLRDMCRDDAFPEIGGAPQIVKIYRHMNSMPYAVYWPSRAAKTISLMGRPLLDYEVASYLILDPDSLETVNFHDA